MLVGAAGAEVRSVFGAEGRIDKQEDDSGQKKKVPIERCCQLICSAAAHDLQVCTSPPWPCRIPTLHLVAAQFIDALAALMLH